MPPAGYLTAASVEACLQYLANTYPTICSLITMPEASIEGRTIHAVKIAKGGGHRHGVLFIGGVHARELINPDLLVGLTLKLCQAYTSGGGLTFGPKTYSAAQVQLIVDGLDVFFLPLVNPDGRMWVQSPAGYAMWRKNRNPNVGQPCKGVDLNRNCDLLWSSGIGTSANSCSDVFKGSGAFSEPETRNVRHMLDTYPDIECFVDVHSYSELILYSWGDDDNQSTEPTMNFMNPMYNGQRGVPGSGYEEYIPAADETWLIDTGTRIRSAIAAVRGRAYTLEQSIGLYPTSGTTKDYAYSRHFVDTGKRRVYAYTLETAREFQPPYSEALQVMDEASAGLVEFCLACICVVEETAKGTQAVQHLNGLREFRDEYLQKTATGRQLVRLVEGHAGELLNVLSEDEKLRTAAQEVLGEVGALISAKDPASEGIAPNLVGALEDLVERLSRHAGRDLQKDLAALRRPLASAAGKTVGDVLADQADQTSS
jgi:carboxypeptidase T